MKTLKEGIAYLNSLKLETDFKDMHGRTICLGDNVLYHHRVARHLDDDEDIDDFPAEQIYGKGQKRYVYTGKIIRYKGCIRLGEDGLEFSPNSRFYAYLYSTTPEGWLATIEVVNKEENNGAID